MKDLSISPWFEIRRYDHIAVMPTRGLYQGQRAVFRGGPLWPDWEEALPNRLFRDGVASDVRPEEEKPEATVQGDRPHFWIGPLDGHFGHFLAEFGTRILPTLVASPSARLVFSSWGGQAGQPLPAVPAAVLEWFKVDPEQVLVVDRPLLFERLYVVPQPETLGRDGKAPNTGFLRALERWADLRLGPLKTAGKLFVTRSGQQWRFCGEAYLDSALAKSGWGILRPEGLPLSEQLLAYRRAESILFSEGSALHGLQLLGKCGPVTVLNRRNNSRLADCNLRPRSSLLNYVDCCRLSISGYWPESSVLRGRKDVARSVTFLDLMAVDGALKRASPPVSLDARAFERSESGDLPALVRPAAEFFMKRSRRSMAPLVEGLSVCGVEGSKQEVSRIILEYGAPKVWPGLLRFGVRTGWQAYARVSPLSILLRSKLRHLKKWRSRSFGIL